MEALDETRSGAPKYCGEVTMRSGQEIYGADIARAVEPNSRVRVMVSVREGKEGPDGRRVRFGWSDGDIVTTKRPEKMQEKRPGDRLAERWTLSCPQGSL